VARDSRDAEPRLHPPVELTTPVHRHSTPHTVSFLRTFARLLALLIILASPSALTGQKPHGGPNRPAVPDQQAAEGTKSLSWHLLLGLGLVLVVGGGFLRRRSALIAEPEAERGAKVTPLDVKRARTPRPPGPAKRTG